ncbi:BTB and MATH domain-containing protein 36-like [Oculina patagonica]
MQDENQAAQELDHEFSKPWEQSDVVLLVEGQQFHVHRLILAMSSPVFSRMFSSDFKEEDADEISLPEKKAAEIREMLLVIYPSFGKRVDDTNFQLLLPLAQEYQMKVLTEKCEDHLLRVIEKEDKIGPLFENLIIAQDYTLERVKSECVNKTQKLSIGQIQGHELYEQVEPLSQRKMIELQVSNMEKTFEKKLRDAQADLRKSKEEISRLQGKLKETVKFASYGLQHFDTLVADLGSHIRQATMQITDHHFSFKFTMEQNLATIKNDADYTTPRAKVCLPLYRTHSPLDNLQSCLKVIQDSK